MFGATLRQLRTQNGVTQAELAAVLNLDASSISKYEKADVLPSADIILKIAQYFNVSTDSLLGVPDIKKTPTQKRVDVDLTEDEVRIIQALRSLPDAERKFLIRAAEAEADRLNKE